MAAYQDLITAVTAGDEATVRELLDHNVPVDPMSVDEPSALTLACQENHTEIAKLLIAKGANVNQRNGSEFTPLRLAIENNNKELVEALLEKKASVNAELGRLGTVLTYCITKAQPQININILQTLLEAGADANQKDAAQKTPLYYLAALFNTTENDLRAADLLIQKGADINLPYGFTINTALHTAIVNKNIKFAAYLIEKGADVSLRNSANESALDIACIQGEEKDKDKGKDKLIQLILAKCLVHKDRQALLDSALRSAARYGQEAIVKLLLQKGAAPDARDEYGNTALDLINRSLGKNISIFTIMKRQKAFTAILLLMAIAGVGFLVVGIGGLAGWPVFAGLAAHMPIVMVIGGVLNTAIALVGLFYTKKLQGSQIDNMRQITARTVNSVRKAQNTQEEILEQLEATAQLLKQADFNRAEKARLALTGVAGLGLIGAGTAALSSAVVMSTLSFGLPVLGLGLAIGAIAIGALTVLGVGFYSYRRYQQQKEIYAIEPVEEAAAADKLEEQSLLQSEVPASTVSSALTGLGMSGDKSKEEELDLSKKKHQRLFDSPSVDTDESERINTPKPGQLKDSNE